MEGGTRKGRLILKTAEDEANKREGKRGDERTERKRDSERREGGIIKKIGNQITIILGS